MKICNECLDKAGFKAGSEHFFGTCAICKASPIECSNFNNAFTNWDKEIETKGSISKSDAVPTESKHSTSSERGSYLWLDNPR